MSQRFCAVTLALKDQYRARRWPSDRITWTVQPRNAGSLTADQVRRAFQAAWDDWARWLVIEPIYVEDPAEAMVVSKFGRIDGSRSVLAWSELADGTMTPRQQLYDDAESWSWEAHPAQRIDLQRVACHEIGHVLGLAHDNEGADALMAPMYSPQIRAPRPRDVLRMERLGYKPRPVVVPGGPPVDPKPTPEPTPGGNPVDKSLLQQLLDSLFATLDTAAAGKPLLRLALGFMKKMAAGWLDDLAAKLGGKAAFRLPGGLTKDALAAFIDNLFAIAEATFAGNDFVLIAVEALHALALTSIDKYVEELRVANVSIAA